MPLRLQLTADTTLTRADVHRKPTRWRDQRKEGQRVAKWLRAIWRGRGKVEPAAWRLYFVVVVDGRAVGMQDLIGVDYSTFGTVTSFSWLADDQRGRGIGQEMRAAILHLAFEGL